MPPMSAFPAKTSSLANDTIDDEKPGPVPVQGPGPGFFVSVE